MSQRVFRLPIRNLTNSRSGETQWTCRRCLTTQLQQPPSTSPPPPNPTKSPSPPKLIKDASEAEHYDPKLPSAMRDYRLTKTDYFLKRPLTHDIPVQYLQHSTTELLPPTERAQRDKVRAHQPIVGVVVSAGKMDKTVKVRVPRMEWNSRIKKHFHGYAQHLVHDPNNSLVPGDVVSLHRLRVSTAVYHVVASIVSPFGSAIDARAPIPSPDDRLSAYKEKRFAKLRRRTLRRKAALGIVEAITELRDAGLDPGKGVEAGAGIKANLEKGTGLKRTPAKGAILGRKGQKLPEGVLPGGKAEVGKINVRARRNKDKAMKFEAQAEANIAEAKVKGEELAKQGIVTKTKLPLQNPVLDPPESGEGWKAPKG